MQHFIRLIVPGLLQYRDIAVRVVAAACKLVDDGDQLLITRDEDTSDVFDLRRPFDAEFVSAVTEILNNIAIHSYRGNGSGSIEIELMPRENHIEATICDYGASFDLGSIPPPPTDPLPDHGWGIHIVKSFVDEVSYEPGRPNVWRLVKYLDGNARLSSRLHDQPARRSARNQGVSTR
jgi:serine/threonine-protein kinase RsbW